MTQEIILSDSEMPDVIRSARDTRVVAMQPGVLKVRDAGAREQAQPLLTLADAFAAISVLSAKVAKLEQESVLSNLWADKWAKEQMYLAQLIENKIPKDTDLQEFRETLEALKKVMKDLEI